MDQRKSARIIKKLRLENMTSILSLPNEVIINILEYLTKIEDKINFSRSCVRVHNLFNSTAKLHRNKLVTVIYLRSFYKLFLRQKDRNIRHIVITNIKFSGCELECLDKFWSEYGENVISISISGCDHQGDDVLGRIVSYCPNLKQLELYSHYNWTEELNKCAELKFEKLEKLESCALSDYSLNNFIKNAPNLKQIGFIVSPCTVLLENNNEEEFNTKYLTIKNLSCVLPQSNITFSRSTIFIRAKEMCKIKEMGLLENICQLKKKGLVVVEP